MKGYIKQVGVNNFDIVTILGKRSYDKSFYGNVSTTVDYVVESGCLRFTVPESDLYIAVDNSLDSERAK
jgi:hypothetical protein